MFRKMAVVPAVALAFACGSERKATEQEGTTGNTAPEVHPSSVKLAPNDVQQFSFSPTTVQVAWSVAESSGGAITQGGLYTAPAYSGVFHVTATSTSSSAVSAQATVTVDSGVRIAVTSPVNAFACEAVALTATVTGSGDTSVLWSAPASCGTVTPAGIFTSVRGTGTCVVTAQAHADPTQVAAVTVNVAPERVLRVAVLPASASLAPSGTQTFTANVTTACGTFPAGT
jgi:hypothetical protein